MKEIPLKKITLKVCEHSDELTADLYTLSNEYALLDAEIGNDSKAIIRHFSRMDQAIQEKDFDKLVLIRKNMHMAFASVISHMNFIGLQFAVHVKSENNKEMTDYSIETLSKKLIEWGKAGLTMKLLRETMEDIKKKSSVN